MCVRDQSEFDIQGRRNLAAICYLAVRPELELSRNVDGLEMSWTVHRILVGIGLFGKERSILLVEHALG